MTTERRDLARSWLLRLACTAVSLATIAVVAAWVLPQVPLWPCDLLQHFRVQYAVVGAIVVAAAALLRVRGYFDVAAIAALLHLWRIAPDLCGEPRPLPEGTALRVLVLNVHTESSSFDQVRQLIGDVQPDVIGLVEVDQRWLGALAPAVAGYPGRITRPRSDNFGVALFARQPLVGSIETLGGDLPSVVAHVVIDGAPLDLVLTHPIPPLSAAALADQRQELDAVADRVRQLPGPVLVIGDLNATPWSTPFRNLVARSGLCDSRTGFGIAASFPATMPAVRIPIDHLLASCAVGIRDRRVERDVGSDHLPVVIDLVVPRAR